MACSLRVFAFFLAAASAAATATALPESEPHAGVDETHLLQLSREGQATRRRRRSLAPMSLATAAHNSSRADPSHSRRWDNKFSPVMKIMKAAPQRWDNKFSPVMKGAPQFPETSAPPVAHQRQSASPKCTLTSAGTCEGEQGRFLTEVDFRRLLNHTVFPKWHKEAILHAHEWARKHPPHFLFLRYKPLMPFIFPVLCAPVASMAFLAIYGAVLVANWWYLHGMPKRPDTSPGVQEEAWESSAASYSSSAGTCSASLNLQTYFWWNDLPPLKHFKATLSLYFLIVAIQMQQMHMKIARAAGASMIFPSVAFLTLEMRRSSVGSAGQILANVILTVSSCACVLAERWHTTYHGEASACSHKWLPQSWTLLGTVIAAWAMLAVADSEVSRWFRKLVMCALACVYFNGGLAKTLNNPRPWDWAQGGILRYYIWHSYHEFRIWDTKWPWLSRLLIDSPYLGMMAAVSVLLFELPLSLIAALGTGEFGRFGIVRRTWSVVAIGFHFGILLLMRPRYDVQAWIIIALVLDLPALLLSKLGVFALSECPSTKASGVRPEAALDKPIKSLIASLSTLIVLAWVFVGVTFHHVDRDPNWPISSVPMYSTLFFLDPSVKVYPKLMVVDVAAPGMGQIMGHHKQHLYKDFHMLNSSIIERLVATKSLTINETIVSDITALNMSVLMAAEVKGYRCFSPHFDFPHGVVSGIFEKHP